MTLNGQLQDYVATLQTTEELVIETDGIVMEVFRRSDGDYEMNFHKTMDDYEEMKESILDGGICSGNAFNAVSMAFNVINDAKKDGSLTKVLSD